MKAATCPWWTHEQPRGISIHAAREGGDVYIYPEYGLKDISIHAAREGGDPLQRLLALKHVYFNPRRP